jgi:hypothetical protein
MSLSKSKCWYSNNILHFLKCAVLFVVHTGQADSTSVFPTLQLISQKDLEAIAKGEIDVIFKWLAKWQID